MWEAAPELVELLWLLAGLIALGIALVATNLAAAIARVLHVSVPVIGDALNWVTNKTTELAQSIANAMEDTFAGNHKKATMFFGQQTKTNEWTAHLTRRNAISTHKLGSFITTVKLPQVQKNATAAATSAALVKAGKLTPLGARQRYQAAQAEATLEKKVEGAILRDLTHSPAFRAAIAADLPLARPIPGVKGGLTKAQIDARIKEYVKAALAAAGLALPIPRVGKPIAIPKPQAKENAETNKRLKRLEKILGITGLAGLIAATLGKEVERFLRCPNTKGIAKSWCASDLSGLLGLLAGIVAVEEGFSLVDFAKTLQAAQADVVNEILPFISEFKDVTL